MKRIFTLTTLVLISFLAGGVLSGQETKKEQKIKIVTVDKSGNKVEIDTLIKDGALMDTIVLKDGKTIVIGSHGAMKDKLAHISEGEGTIYVTVSSDSDKDKGEKVEKVVIARNSGGSGSSAFTIVTDGADVKSGKTVYVNEGKTIVKEGEGGKVMTWSTKEGNEKGERVVYIHDGNADVKHAEKAYGIRIISGDEGDNVDKTKCVIAKDGLVVTIEGNDEAKVQELMKEIELKLGVVKEGEKNKPVVKEETKKTTKK